MNFKVDGDYLVYHLNEKVSIHASTPNSDILRTLVMAVTNAFWETLTKDERLELGELSIKEKIYSSIPSL